MHQPLVVAVNGNGKQLFGADLTDNILVQFMNEFPRGGDTLEQLSGRTATPLLLIQNGSAQINALAADVHVFRTFDQRPDFAVIFAAKGAVRVALPLLALLPASKILTRWHYTSFGSHSPRQLRVLTSEKKSPTPPRSK